MKKALLLTLFSSVAILTASAQVWIGGEMYYKSNSATLSDFEVNSNKSVGIMPEVGYRISDKWAVALRMEFTHSNDGTVSLAQQTLTGNMNQFSIRPFVRFTLYKKGQLGFYLDGGPGYSTLSLSGYSSFNTIDAAISPALCYDLNDHWALTAHLGKVRYAYFWTDFRNDKLKNNSFDVDVLGSLSFGLTYSF